MHGFMMGGATRIITDDRDEGNNEGFSPNLNIPGYL